MEYTIYTDGSYSVDRKEGAFAFIILKGNEIIHRVAGKLKDDTCNRAEMKAVIAGVYSLPDDATRVNIISDSMYTIKTLGDTKRPRNNKDLYDMWKKRVLGVRNIEIVWLFVKGHSGDYYNSMCDKMCTQKMSEKAIHFY